MIFSLLNFLRGYLIIEVYGVFLERFINLAIKSNIFLWDIKKRSRNTATMKVSVRGFFHIRKAARKTRVKVKIIKRCGLPMFVHKHRKRKAFYIGFLIFVLIISLLTSFIWTVEIEKTSFVDEKLIRDELKACGIDVGVIKYGHSAHEIQDKLMMKIPSLSWIWVEIRGTRAIVSVKERTRKPEIFDKNTPCNIVAKYDGVIEKITAINGNQIALPGDVVKKGDLLISGVYDAKYDGVRLVNAEGTALATTWHTLKETFPLQRVATEQTGKNKKQIILSAGGKDIKIFPLWGHGFEKFETTEENRQIKLWGDLYLPFKIKIKTINEIAEHTLKMSEYDAFVYYRDILIKSLEKELDDEVEILEKTAEHKLYGNNITVSVTLKCRCDIAEKRAIQTGG